jgi:MFS family permease
MNKTNIWGVILVIASAFVGSAAGTMYAGIMPIHAVELGAPSWLVTSLPMGLPSIIGVIVLIPIAILADRTGRRKEIILVVMGLTAIANVGLALSGSWASLGLWRLISGLPFAFMSIYALLVAFMFPPEKRGVAMSIGLGGPMLGMGVFQSISGYLMGVLGGYSGLYYLAAGLAVLAILLLLPVKVPVVKSATGISGKDIIGVIKNKNIIYTGITLMIYLVGWQAMYGSFSYVLVDKLNTPVALQTVFFAVASVMLGLGTFIWGPFIDKFGTRKTLFFALLLSAVATFAMLPVLDKMWGYVLLFWLATIGGVCGSPDTSTVATKSVKPELATIAINTMFIFVFLPGIIGGFIAGPIIAGLGLFGFILIMAIVELVGALMTLRVPEV